MIIVRGSIVAAEGQLAGLLEISLEHVHRSRQEAGCLEHGVYADAENPNRLSFFERWADEDALRQHFALRASRDFVKQARALSVDATPIEIYRSEPVRL